MDECIVEYSPDRQREVEVFRRKAIQEGNDSLDNDKLDLNRFNGRIWLAYVDSQLVSMAAAEVSHYTGEQDVLRLCRYHILKSHRHGRYGFKFLNHMALYAQAYRFRLIYWTHDVRNKPLNALYQRTRKYAFSNDNAWFNLWPYSDLQFHTDRLFKTGDVLQFVYSIAFDKDYVWMPWGGPYMLYYRHDGMVTDWLDIRERSICGRDTKYGISMRNHWRLANG